MNDINQNLISETKIIKNYIKDLSFENLQNFNNQTLKEEDVKLLDNINAIFHAYNNNNFSVLLKYGCECTLLKNKETSFIIELDYFGLFNINNINSYNQDDLTRSGCSLLFPFLKNIIEFVSLQGAPFKVSLKESQFNLIKN